MEIVIGIRGHNTRDLARQYRVRKFWTRDEREPAADANRRFFTARSTPYKSTVRYRPRYNLTGLRGKGISDDDTVIPVGLGTHIRTTHQVFNAAVGGGGKAGYQFLNRDAAMVTSPL